MTSTTHPEESLRQFVRHAPAAVAMFDTELRYLHVSDRWLEDCGLTASDVIGRYHYDVVPDLPERWKATHRRALAGATERCERDVFLRADGSTEYLQWQIQPWHRSDHTIGGIIMFTQFITERVRVEEALRASDERFRSAMHHSPIGMVILDVEGRLLDANPALCHIVGYELRELRDGDLNRLSHPEDVHADCAEMRRLLNGDLESFESEKRYLHRSGHAVWVQLNLSAIRTLGGRVHHFVGQIQDITTRRRNQVGLQISAAKLTLAMAMAKLGYWEYDVPRGRFTIDDAFHRLFRRPTGSVRPRHFSLEELGQTFLARAESIAFAREIERAIASSDAAYTRQFKQGFDRPDDSPGVMAVRLSIQHDANGRTVKVYGVNQDVTERHRLEHQHRTLETQLRHAQKMEAIGTLAGGVAHEFNNLLTGIMGNIQLAEMDPSDARSVQNCLTEATQSCRAARDLIERLLSFSQQAQPLRLPVPFVPVLRTALQQVASMLPALIELRIALPDEGPWVCCDPAEITQVLQQVSANAVQAMVESGGVLEVRLEQSPPPSAWRETYPQVDLQHSIRLSIRDTGIGMTSTLLSRVFDPFFTTKPFGQGAGLGLPIVHGIMKRHRGTVVIESTPGQGTTVHLLFRQAPPASAARAMPAGLEAFNVAP